MDLGLLWAWCCWTENCDFSVDGILLIFYTVALYTPSPRSLRHKYRNLSTAFKAVSHWVEHLSHMKHTASPYRVSLQRRYTLQTANRERLLSLNKFCTPSAAPVFFPTLFSLFTYLSMLGAFTYLLRRHFYFKDLTVWWGSACHQYMLSVGTDPMTWAFSVPCWDG